MCVCVFIYYIYIYMLYIVTYIYRAVEKGVTRFLIATKKAVTSKNFLCFMSAT